MNSRSNLLAGLFRSLEAEGIGYCVLRNYANIYADETSDVDLLLEQRDLEKFRECLRQAAGASNHRLVHKARYVNHSYVFWNAEGGFLRIDFETEVRWRFFPILAARPILDQRKRHEDFYVPHPVHESVVLLGQAVWRRGLSDRYRRQLVSLYRQCGDEEVVRRTYREAFGGIGDELQRFHAAAATAPFDGELCRRVRRSLITRSFTRPAALGETCANVLADMGRLWGRLRKPAGISLLFASAAREDRDFELLVRKLEFLFPAQKCFIQTIDLTNAPGTVPGWKIGLELRRLRTLFKGGLFVRYYRVARDADLRGIIRTHPRLLYPSRAFFCLEAAGRRACLAHVGTGYMTDLDAGRGEFSALLIGFVATVLEKEKQPGPDRTGRRGAVVVLLGLDGSGKTTLARALAGLAAQDPRFDGVRYYHWRPKIFRTMEFPLPEPGNLPRKSSPSRGLANSMFSALRLLKNVVLVNAAFLFRVRPLLRRNFLVMIDRYFYNYLLDPDSVRYAGSKKSLPRMLRWFPRPDYVLTLSAPPEVLLARKQELSPEQIARQTAILEKLDHHGAVNIALDAREPSAHSAALAMAELTRH